jgi:hypothetical protein
VRWARVLLAVLAVVQTAVLPAQSDPEIGSRVKQRKPSNMERAREYSARAAHGYMTCIVNRRATMADRFLRTTDLSEAAKLESLLFRQVGCNNIPGLSDYSTGQRLSLSDDIRRGLLAEALIESRGRLLVPSALPVVAQYATPWATVSGRGAVVEEMAVCMAATNPVAIRQLLRTIAETSEENEAFRILIPQVGPCLQRNAKLTASRQSMRAALAEALYHRLDEPASPSASGQRS